MVGPHHQLLPDLFGRATLVLNKHAMLRDSVEALRIRRDAIVDVSGPPPPELQAMAMDFARQLLAHFAVEEGEEYFGALAKESPELLEPIAGLKREHRDMERLVSDLEAAATAKRFVAHLGDLLDRFAVHERREAALLEGFFCGELSKGT